MFSYHLFYFLAGTIIAFGQGNGATEDLYESKNGLVSGNAGSSGQNVVDFFSGRSYHPHILLGTLIFMLMILAKEKFLKSVDFRIRHYFKNGKTCPMTIDYDFYVIRSRRWN